MKRPCTVRVSSTRRDQTGKPETKRFLQDDMRHGKRENRTRIVLKSSGDPSRDRHLGRHKHLDCPAALKCGSGFVWVFPGLSSPDHPTRRQPRRHSGGEVSHAARQQRTTACISQSQGPNPHVGHPRRTANARDREGREFVFGRRDSGYSGWSAAKLWLDLRANDADEFGHLGRTAACRRAGSRQGRGRSTIYEDNGIGAKGVGVAPACAGRGPWRVVTLRA